MSGIKCRLCQCLVDKQTGFSCSLNDDGFRSMIKTVFPFPISPVHTVASKTYNMPVLVCFQCSTAIRNFYNFSKQVEVIQAKLKRQCLGKDSSMTIDQLVQYIKAEPGLQEELRDVNVNTNESLMMSVDIEATDCESAETSSPMNANEEENDGDQLHFLNRPIAQDYKWISEPWYEPIRCVDKFEVVNNIVDVERRVNLVATKLEELLQNSTNSRQQIPPRRGSQFASDVPEQTASKSETVQFERISTVEMLEAFNQRLSDEQYFDKFTSWLASNVSYGEMRPEHRMQEAFYVLLDPRFVTQCTWSGYTAKGVKGQKVAFCCYQNIRAVLRKVSGETTTEAEVKAFLLKKLRNAKGHLERCKHIITSSCKKKYSRGNKS
uniref:ZAD domain-containing protein n=1 Tax=Anopheles atroparvus TaxID=41427 RepID=A0AAG5DEZ4_ANOAO